MAHENRGRSARRTRTLTLRANLMNSITLEQACEKLEGLDLRNDSAAQEIFCEVALEYANHELKGRGIDLLAIASIEDVGSYCKLWLSRHSVNDNDLALIGVAYSIQLNVKELLARNKTN
jgi:hypothetical protein